MHFFSFTYLQSWIIFWLHFALELDVFIFDAIQIVEMFDEDRHSKLFIRKIRWQDQTLRSFQLADLLKSFRAIGSCR
jgi:hypothetical protein